MKLKTINIAIFLLVLSFAINVSQTMAESGSDDANEVEDRVKVRQEVRDDRMKIRQETRSEVNGVRTETKLKLEEGKMEYKEKVKALNASNASSTLYTKREIKAEKTDLFKKMKEERKEIVNKMQKNAFEVRKNALVKQLTITLENLTNIRARISERITKAEEAGRTMTEAKAALVIADDKLAKAKTAVEALSKLTPETASSTSATSTPTEVNLEKPRQVGDLAIKAVKDARDALKTVVNAIAKNMGLGEDKKTATSTTN